MVAGRGQMTNTDEAMEIYGIGQFLEFNMLSQGLYNFHYIYFMLAFKLCTTDLNFINNFVS